MVIVFRCLPVMAFFDMVNWCMSMLFMEGISSILVLLLQLNSSCLEIQVFLIELVCDVFHLPNILGFELLQLLLIVGLYLELIFLHLLLKLEIILICLIKSPTQLLLFSKVISIIDVVGILAFS